jgi:hypothetical protein
MSKPFMSTTFAGFPDFLVKRVIQLKNLEEGAISNNNARVLLRDNGVTILNFGNPWVAGAVDDNAIVQEMCDTLQRWAYVVFI